MESSRLILKPTAEEDADFICELFNTPKWLKYIGDRNVKTSEDARKYILSRILTQHERMGFSNFTIIRKTDKIKIGICGLFVREGIEGIDIGFALLPKYEKKGYAFEAAERIRNAAFSEFGLKEINAITTEDNYASQKLLGKLGFEFIKMVKLPGDELELLMYNLSIKNRSNKSGGNNF